MDRKKVQEIVKELLVAIGEDPGRPGLNNTPERVASMLGEIFSGIKTNPDDLVKKFVEPDFGYKNLIVIEDIPIYSICEHHLLPFIGTATIKYIPKNGVIMGLSKFARIVDAFARRLQVQERLTVQITDFLFENLAPVGIEVTIQAEHLCMTMRGVKSYGSKTKTVATRGDLGEHA